MNTQKYSILRAARVLNMVPGQEPIRDAAIVHDGRFIVQIGPWKDICRTFDRSLSAHEQPEHGASAGTVHDLGNVTLCPGVFNAHTHLDLSHMLGKTVRGQGFTSWVKSLLANRAALDQTETKEHCRRIQKDGTAFVADISSSNASELAGILDDSGLFFAVFQEMILFAEPTDATECIPDGTFQNGVLSCSGHAPYSTRPDLLQRAKRTCSERGLPFSLHLAEHDDETRMLMGEANDYFDLLQQARIPMNGFTPPRTSSVQYAHDLGLLDADTLAVHCVTVGDADIAMLCDTGTNVCLCPRSNEYIDVGRAPWEKFLAAGVNICLGTDGLCSNDDLNVWNELAWIKERIQCPLSLEDGLAMLTRNPAQAFHMKHRLGTLEPGKAARWAVVPDHLLELFEK